MERLIKKAMTKFFDENSLLNKHQHGFVKFKSCVTNLLETFDFITENINRGFAIDILFIDFMKAFDLVAHPELLIKLEAYGFKDKLLSWIKAFLTDRRQRVVLDGYKSSWKNVLSGVPQGSVLGPLLFIIFINDLPNGLSVLCKLFADDSKLMHVIRNSKDRDEFQTNINRLLSWANDWKLNLNLSKCKVMHHGNKKIHQDHHYTLDLTDYTYILENTKSERDLGIQVQSDLKWEDQINNVVMKANGILGKLKSSFKNWDVKTFKTLYTSHVRPILEYGSTAWRPFRKQDIKKIEKVQRRATKSVPILRNKSYEERLRVLSLTTLEDRRTRGDLIQFYKLNEGFNSIDWYHPMLKNPCTSSSGPAGSLRNRNSLYRQLVKSCRVRDNFFTNRIIPHWNRLPEEVKQASSVNNFKNKFDQFQNSMTN
jgi:hypothetical protein